MHPAYAGSTVKSSSKAQSATSIPRAPRDDESSRSTRYLITMGIRIACFVLMVVITPYGWYTWIFGAGAIFLPYIAVVMANAGSDAKPVVAVKPERALEAAPSAVPPVAESTSPRVIRIEETRRIDPPGQSPAA